jgi:hypothetical protein
MGHRDLSCHLAQRISAPAVRARTLKKSPPLVANTGLGANTPFSEAFAIRTQYLQQFNYRVATLPDAAGTTG